MDFGGVSRLHLITRRGAEALLALAVVAVTTFVAHLPGTNPVTDGFAYLIAVLLLATRFGLFAGTVASVAATFCFSYYSLPPLHSFRMEDPENWIALVSFLICSVIANRLVLAARRQAVVAERRRGEIEALYRLSLDLFTGTVGAGGFGEATVKALRTVGALSGRVILVAEGKVETEASFGTGDAPSPEVLRAVLEEGKAVEIPGEEGARDLFIPVAIGPRTRGALAVRQTRANREALESVARLLALALEREGLLAERSHLQAVKESEAFKTSLLRAVSHDLRTPLTSIRMGLEMLRAAFPEAGHTALQEIQRESERLSRRIDNLLAMARLEAGTSAPRVEPTPPPDLFRTALENLPLVLEGRRVSVRVGDGCPDILVDPYLTVEILVNLLENAASAAPSGEPIEVSADGTSDGRVRIEILDRGPGIPDLLKTGPARRSPPGDSGRGGLGLEICRSFAGALGGAFTLMDRPGGGTIARLELPAAPAVLTELP